MNKQTEALRLAIEALKGKTDKAQAIQACREALEQPQCNPHPKAPHGFNRDASHSADRYDCDCEGWDAWEDGYDCDCEGWDAWEDGYDEGLRRGLEL